jgi:hypothetical protein
VALLACPFCRALYSKGEAPACPDCGLALVPLERLPPSADVLADDEGVQQLPEDQPLPWSAWGRGRALLLALAVIGLVSFFLPWVELTSPESELRSGFELARGRLGWLWGGAVGWFVVVPLVLSRRTVAAMRGVRPITAVFCVLTLLEVLMLVLVPPTPPPGLTVVFDWAFGLYLSGATSAAGALTALFFGGSLPPLPTTKQPMKSSFNRTLH